MASWKWFGQRWNWRSKADDEQTVPSLVPKPKTKSAVWTAFILKVVARGRHAIYQKLFVWSTYWQWHILDWLHVPCFDHNLHLAITIAIKDDPHVTRAPGMIRKLITLFSHSWNKKRYVKKTQGISPIDFPTRWVLNRLRQVLSVDRKTAHLVPTWQNLEVSESIDKTLSLLADFTEIFL